MENHTKNPTQTPVFTKEFLSFRQEQAQKWKKMEKQRQQEAIVNALLEEQRLKNERLEQHQNEYSIQRIIRDLADLIRRTERAKEIIEIDMYVSDFSDRISINIGLIKQLDHKAAMFDKVVELISAINQNPNTTFDVTDTFGYQCLSPSRINKKIRNALQDLEYDPEILGFSAMNTDSDEELAKRLQEEEDQKSGQWRRQTVDADW